jgi:hypothetical protein
MPAATHHKLIIDRDLQLQISEWKSNKSVGINDPPSVYYEAQEGPDETMTVVNAADKKFGGALVSNKRPLPKWDGKTVLQYVSMYIRFKWPAEVYWNIARHELDLKACIKTRKDPDIPERNVMDGSTQWNRDTGQFQIDYQPDPTDENPDPIPLWTDTGYVVKDIAPDVWHDLYMNYWFNKEVYSVLSIQLDDNPPYMIPEQLQNVILTNSNWEEVSSVQIQNEVYEPGHNLIHYGKVLLAWSDGPINLPALLKYAS